MCPIWVLTSTQLMPKDPRTMRKTTSQTAASGTRRSKQWDKAKAGGEKTEAKSDGEGGGKLVKPNLK